MKNSIQIKIQALLVSLAMLVLVINCHEKKKDNSSLAIGALLLNQAAAPTWSVTMTATLREASGANLAATNVVTLTNNTATTTTATDIKQSLVLSSGATNVQVFASTAAVGVFTISFTVSSASTPLRLAYTTLAAGGNADTVANYTVDAGSSTFTLIANDSDTTNLAQVSGLTSTGKTLTVSSIRTVKSGSYSLPNPTVGETLCDGTNASTPTVKSGTISAAETWSGAILLQGTVVADAPITVTAGTVIFGSRGSSLFIRGANKLTAIGTASNPICWTSSSKPGSRQPGDWGGIVTVGNSGTTRATAGSTEGTTPLSYGGGTTTPGTNNLELVYNIVEFGGNEVAPGDELNNISMYASNSILNYVQAHRGLDDQFEAWGGQITWSKMVATGGLDDDYDLDEGVKGTITNAIGHKYPSSCGGTVSTDPNGLEWDGVNSGSINGYGATTVTLNKFVLIGAGTTAGKGAMLREGTQATLTNGVFYDYTQGIDLRGGNSQTSALTATNVRMNSSASNFNAPSSSTTTASELTGVTRDLTALPIVSDAGINTESNCGFTATKPDYTLTSTAASALGAGDGATNFWSGWTVYRGR